MCPDKLSDSDLPHRPVFNNSEKDTSNPFKTSPVADGRAVSRADSAQSPVISISGVGFTQFEDLGQLRHFWKSPGCHF